MNSQPVASGAEAEIFETEFLGRPAMVKIRSPKAYRHPDLDHRIRSSRIKSEAKLMRDARNIGVRTPIIYDVDIQDCSITMERISGKKVKDLLDEEPQKADIVCRMIGEAVAELHNAGISHGDLTTSNMIVMEDGKLCMIDFSMGSSKIEIEDMGVDIRLLERAFSSAHPKLKDSYEMLIEEYCAKKTDSKIIMKKVQEIKDRGRYT